MINLDVDPEFSTLFGLAAGLVATDAGRHNMAAPLLAFGIADMTRDGSRVPPKMQEEWDTAWGVITEHIDDPDAVQVEWSEKTMGEVVPVALATLTELRRTLESAEG